MKGARAAGLEELARTLGVVGAGYGRGDF